MSTYGDPERPEQPAAPGEEPAAPDEPADLPHEPDLAPPEEDEEDERQRI